MDRNGVVDDTDVSIVALMAADAVTDDLRADFNRNGVVDVADAAKIEFYVLGLIGGL